MYAGAFFQAFQSAAINDRAGFFGGWSGVPDDVCSL